MLLTKKKTKRKKEKKKPRYGIFIGIGVIVILVIISGVIYKVKFQKENLIKEIKASKAKVILTLGAGDIGVEVKSIKGALLNED